ncbi:MAG: hypothetical protein WBG50_01080 [Desulfomonilaceae bacterium]
MIYAHSATCRESLESLAADSESHFVIAGLGKFGRLALDRLQRSFPGSRITAVEQDEAKAAGNLSAPVTVFQGDAVSFLVASPLLRAEDLIIPMVPFNLAAAYVLARHPKSRQTPIPNQVLGSLPNPMLINESNVVCSRANFVCPDDCPEDEFCTVTGEPRGPLYDELGRLEIPGFNLLVQKSSQILPGVGGYKLGDLRLLSELVDKGRFIVATSCKCHGILTAIIA